MKNKIISSKVFISISVWLIVSSIYYSNFLLEGDVSPGRNQSFFQSSLKICIPFFIGLYIYLKNSNKSSFDKAAKALILSVLLIMSLYFRVFSNNFKIDLGLIFLFELIAITCSIFLFGGLLQLLDEEQIKKIGNIILFSGVLVSFFSVFEIFFLSHLYQEYWIRIEGMRSVSSLLNPNNSGVYMGACILLLLLSEKSLTLKISMGVIFLFPLILSGSRTSWVCLFFVLIIFFINNLIKNKINWFLAIVLFIILSFVFVFFDFFVSLIDYFGYDLSSRLTDNRSSEARLNKYSEFLLNFNIDYFFPDIYNKNIILVSESSYFTYLNYFGIFGCFLFLFLILIYYKFSLVRSEKCKPWIFIFIYYLFVGIFESLVTSFPNNQLFMLSAGCLISFRSMSNKRDEVLRSEILK